MSAEEPGTTAASCCPETPVLYSWDEDEEVEKDEEGSGGDEAKSQRRSSSGESEESEPEPPPASGTRRKVSFADAFGLDLVSVKEFDSTAESRQEDLMVGEPREGEEYHLSCLFTAPASDEELAHRLQQNKLELENIELLPGSTTIRGVIRVLNLSFHKAVYVRTTLDGWKSHFDLLAEYVPGSSDGETDRFSFKLTLVPPFQAEGARVEFCLRYESSVGTFWANEGGMNYVLFCQQRGGRELKEQGERETEESSHKGKRSCLKAIRKRSSAESKPTCVNGQPPEPDSSRAEETEEGKTQHEEERGSSKALQECRKALAERRSRRRAARMARMQDVFSQRTEDHLEQGDNRERTERGLKVVLPLPQISAPVGLDASNVPSRREKNEDTPPILTYHQIPLLSLDWGKQAEHSSHPYALDKSSGTSSDVPEKHLIEKALRNSTFDVWEAFINGTKSSERNTNGLDEDHSLRLAESDALLSLHAERDMSVPGGEGFSVGGATRTVQESPVTSGNGSPECFSAKETLELDLVEQSQDFKPSRAREGVLPYEHAEKQAVVSETQVFTDSEKEWALCGAEGSDNMTQDRPTPMERPSSKGTNETETVQIVDVGQRSKAPDGVSLEECSGSLIFSETVEFPYGGNTETETVTSDALTFDVRQSSKAQDKVSPEESSSTPALSDRAKEKNGHIVTVTSDAVTLDVRQSSKAQDGVSFEECSGKSTLSDTAKPRNGEFERVTSNSETLTAVRDGSLSDKCAERKEYTSKVKNNEGQFKARSWSKCSESGSKLEDEEPSQRDQSTKIWVTPVDEGVVFEESKLHKWTGSLNKEFLRPQGEENEVCCEQVKEGPIETNESATEEMLSVTAYSNVANGECESSEARAESWEEPENLEVRPKVENVDDAWIDTITHKEIHKPRSNTDTFTYRPILSITDHTNDPSETFSWTEPSEGEPLLFPSTHLKGTELRETMRHSAVRDLRDLNAETENPIPVSTTTAPSACKIPTGLLAWWIGFCTLGYVSRAVVCAILFVIFITVYMHDLPVCLAIYLLSVCWWCGQGMRKKVASADSVD